MHRWESTSMGWWWSVNQKYILRYKKGLGIHHAPNMTWNTLLAWCKQFYRNHWHNSCTIMTKYSSINNTMSFNKTLCSWGYKYSALKKNFHAKSRLSQAPSIHCLIGIMKIPSSSISSVLAKSPLGILKEERHRTLQHHGNISTKTIDKRKNMIIKEKKKSWW